jgi:VIT1/CCC1 family predicted Fe2+/Mn2+ transporter
MQPQQFQSQHSHQDNGTTRSEYTWRQAEEVRKREEAAFAALERDRKLNLKAFLMSVAVLMAPFFALLFGVDAALFVLGLAMVFTSWVTWGGSNHVAPSLRSKLRTAAIFNGVLAVLVFGLLALRQFA